MFIIGYCIVSSGSGMVSTSRILAFFDKTFKFFQFIRHLFFSIHVFPDAGARKRP